MFAPIAFELVVWLLENKVNKSSNLRGNSVLEFPIFLFFTVYLDFQFINDIQQVQLYNIKFELIVFIFEFLLYCCYLELSL